MSEKRVELEVLGLSSGQSHSGSFALVLGEKHGKKRLPIIIGMAEAQSIAIEIEQIKPNRPFTHDLFKSFCEEFDLQVLEILITNLKEGIFYATMLCSNGEKTIELDSRPSDAIALGLRFKAPIYVYQKVLDEAGIILTEEEENLERQEIEFTPEEEEEAKVEIDQVMSSEEFPLKEFSDEQLKLMLDDALASEDYEKAASIRDELKKRGID